MVARGGCYLSSAALSTAPCQGSSRPFWPASCLWFLHLQGTTCALALSGSCAHGGIAAEASAALLPLAPLPQLPSLGQNSLRLPGPQACCTSSSCNFAALPACNACAGQARERFPCITGREAQRSKFGKAEGMLVVDACPTLENTPRCPTLPLLQRSFVDTWS